MRTVSIRVGVVRGALPATVGNARRRWSHRESVILALRDGDGCVGLGEASPLPGYSSDTVEDVLHALADVSSLGQDAALDQLVHSPSARFAYESALLDLEGQRRGQPIHQMLSDAPRERVARCSLLDGETSAWPEKAQRFLDRGVSTLKVKVGRAFAPLFELRRQLPGEWRLRLDANGGWSLDESQYLMNVLAPLEPEFVEQPVAPGELAGLRRCAVPWAADESLRNPGEAEELLRSACTTFVLKPAVLGGLRAAFKLATRARAHGLDSIASHLFDGPIALAATCELALALPESHRASGIDTHDALAAWPTLPVPQLREPGEIVPALLPGLGFSDEVRQEVLTWIH